MLMRCKYLVVDIFYNFLDGISVFPSSEKSVLDDIDCKLSGLAQFVWMLSIRLGAPCLVI